MDLKNSIELLGFLSIYDNRRKSPSALAVEVSQSLISQFYQYSNSNTTLGRV